MSKAIQQALDKENESLIDLIELFIHKNPKKQIDIKFSANEIVGAIRLAYQRGLQEGKNIKQKSPDATFRTDES